MKVKKGKATLLALASAALVASLVYDKKYKKSLADKEEREELDNNDNAFIIK
ncbi:MAG: hypothetical protein ACRCTZ_12315 [Sarcina sp.]